jgi:hypothetical protein
MVFTLPVVKVQCRAQRLLDAAYLLALVQHLLLWSKWSLPPILSFLFQVVKRIVVTVEAWATYLLPDPASDPFPRDVMILQRVLQLVEAQDVATRHGQNRSNRKVCFVTCSWLD